MSVSNLRGHPQLPSVACVVISWRLIGMRFTRALALVLVLIGGQRAGAQAPPAATAPDVTLSKADRVAAIEGLTTAMTRGYVFPEKATEVERALRAHVASGVYDTVVSGRAFADLLTRQLQAVTRDKHLRVRVAPANASGARRGGPPSAEERLNAARAANYGFGRAEILAGNIGYLELRGFGAWVSEARDTVARIMSKLADTDALIIDLRENGGGSPEAVAFVSSYLFGDAPVHLNSLYFRPADRTDDFHTDPT